MSAMPSPTVLPPAPADGWTVDDLDALPDDDGFGYELVDGALLVTPPAALRHEHAVTRLAVLLDGVLEPPWCVLAGGGVRFDDRNYRQPDLQVLRRAALDQKLARPGDVLLAVEVMSPGSVSNDRVAKPALYAAAGIPHYWRLEPGPVLITHDLDGAVYRESGRFTGAVALERPVRVRGDLVALLE